jgi:O-antigen ligase/tetratricopeptide (TPR) repeat protein
MKDILKWVVYGGIFTVPAIVLIVSNDLFFPYITGKNFTFRIIVEIAVAAWVLLALYDARYRPRFSWLAGFGALLLVTMLISNLMGEHPAKSFWSNFERMEGYVTLVHFYLYFLMVGTMLTTDVLWNRFFNVTLGVAAIVSLYAFAQVSGEVAISQGNEWRVDATLGNSTYMAVYMLFHIAIAVMMTIRARASRMRYAYGAAALVFAFLLLQTGTRGATLGLIGGVFLATLYTTVFSSGNAKIRTFAGATLAAIVLLVGGFWLARDSAFVQNSPMLDRIANISLAEGSVRFMIWDTALKGIKERPLFGWGQENFNYIFNTHYTPELYRAESWYDRTHNIVMDWLVAGGIFGALAYFGLLGAAVWYVAIRPLVQKDDQSFTVIERGILLGLLAGYTVHNLFVFDNIVSYVFYAAVLGYIHARVAPQPSILESRGVSRRIVEQVAAPLVLVALIGTVYYVNVPSIRAAGDIIDAFRATDNEVMLQGFERALSRGSFADQEIREQMMQRIQGMAAQPDVPADFRERALARVEEELQAQSLEKPNDARVELFLSVFYRAIGDHERAASQLAVARALSPKKQVTIFEQGFNELDRGDIPSALVYFKEAYDLAPSFDQARGNYANAALYADDTSLWRELISTDAEKTAYALNDNAIRAVYAKKLYPELIEMFKTRITIRPQEPQERANLAYIYDELGRSEEAIAVLRQAIIDIPAFKTQADQFITNIQNKIATTTVGR